MSGSLGAGTRDVMRYIRETGEAYGRDYMKHHWLERPTEKTRPKSLGTLFIMADLISISINMIQAGKH